MSDYDAIVIGGGPAGSSAAISLVNRGARVLLLEATSMPRGKLCGEFIAPEAFPTLERLGVMQRMLSDGAHKITRASLVASNGNAVQTHLSRISANASWALSLSRSRFDQNLFDRAREAGVECREGVSVKSCIRGRGLSHQVEALSLAKGSKVIFRATVIVDASGRNSRMMLRRKERASGRQGSRLYALKAHFEGVRGIDDQVELHFFPQGYGGFSRIEGGLVNLCFIVDESTLRNAGGDPSKVLERSVMSNEIARERMREAVVVGKWHSAGPLTFGHRRLTRDGVIAVGDASGMIDPFTGTGIQMALRTGEMAADAITEVLGSTGNKPADEAASSILDLVLNKYSIRYNGEFRNRLNAAGLLRALAFSPRVAPIVASVLARAPWLARFLLQATRSTSGPSQ
jgi:geranylgeranyl reductase family protein